jgi:uncharacterized protein HemX
VETGADRPTTPVAPPTPEQRIEGLRAWIAQVDRKLGIRTYAGGAAVVLALAAGIVGVVLALSAKDESASKDDVTALSEQVQTATQQASESAAKDLSSISQQLDELENRVSALASSQRTTESQLQVARDDIDELRSQVSSSGGSGGDSP